MDWGGDGLLAMVGSSCWATVPYELGASTMTSLITLSITRATPVRVGGRGQRLPVSHNERQRRLE